MISAYDFVNTAIIPLREKAGYIWGSYGQMWTQESQNALNRTTDSDRALGRQYGAKWIGHRVWDCSGLIYWICYVLYGEKMNHGSNTIWNERCAHKGKLTNGKRSDGQTLLPGSCVFLLKNGVRHHIGVYIGGGVCVEAKGTKSGVVVSDIEVWDEWGELKCVDYTYAEGVELEVATTIRLGCYGDAVTKLQNNLNQLGYDCGKADGIFGQNTRTAVMSFQNAHGLKIDGIVGEQTMAALNAELEKTPVDENVGALEQKLMRVRGLANQIIREIDG